MKAAKRNTFGFIRRILALIAARTLRSPSSMKWKTKTIIRAATCIRATRLQ